ncbi:MAG TPA: hypothetical protein VFJ19_19750 [Nocardioidaceae bacterium]|nr:hypothetical protein [Nocardioidaceae bacterium]
MASYAVDSSRQPMTATGIVEPVREWEETPEGKRRPSQIQARDEDTGMALWAVEVLYIQTSFGRKSTVTAKVTIGSESEPKPAPLTPVEFGGLEVEARVNKAGGFVESWHADHLATPAAGSGTAGKSVGRSTGDEKAA